MSEDKKRKTDEDEMAEVPMKKLCDEGGDSLKVKSKAVADSAAAKNDNDDDEEVGDSDLELLMENEEEEDLEDGDGKMGDEDSDSDEEEDEEENDEFAEYINNAIDVDFSAFDPEEVDFHGIKCLLQRLWLKEDIDLSSLTDLLIKDNIFSSVLKQDNEDDDDEGEVSEGGMDDGDKDEVYCIFSLIPFNDYHRSKYKCVQQISAALSKYISEEHPIFKHLKSDWALVVNERFINLPPKFSVPCYEHLVEELKSTLDNKKEEETKKYSFDNVIMVSKLLKEKVKGSNTYGGNTIYVNGEEEIFSEKASASVEYSVAEQCDPDCVVNWGNTGSKDYEDQPIMEPFRKIMFFTRDAWIEAVKGLKEAIN